MGLRKPVMVHSIFRLCQNARALDLKLSKLGVSFLSNEARIFCNLVTHSGKSVKVISNAPDVSPKSAAMALEKIVHTRLAIKDKSPVDKRSFVLSFNFSLFPNENDLTNQNMDELVDMAYCI